MKRKDLLIIIISAFIIILLWIGFSIYHGAITSTITEALNTNIQPISPFFNNQGFKVLKQRNNVTPLYDLKSNIASSSSITISPTPTTIASLSATPTPAGGSTSTQSGGLKP